LVLDLLKFFVGELRLGLNRFCIVKRVVIEGGRLEHELRLLEGQQLRRLLLSWIVKLPWLIHLGVLYLLWWLL
jgi:hypothetical protein